jgi:tetraacyldisaccharide 4'-kinase
MTPSLSTYWRGLANGTRKGILDRLLLALLILLSLPYALIQQLRAGLYQTGILAIKHLPRPVISVGNITVGGTGKTPVTAYIARLLMEHGLKVAVLSRGYGGTLEGQTSIVSNGRDLLLTAGQCGDEPYLLAKTIPGLMVIIGIDRHAAGMLAMERLSPDIFLLDDGFQHIRLHRDLDILLLDSNHPFGNGWTLPSGMLREPRSAARRAGLVIMTRCPAKVASALVLPGKPLCHARHEIEDAVSLEGGAPVLLNTLGDKKLLAFAGIAEPQAFFDGLRSKGLNLVHTLSFPDHATYNSTQIAAIADAMHSCGTDFAITTEKDGVKLGHMPPELAEKTLLARLKLTIEDSTPLTALVLNLLQK